MKTKIVIIFAAVILLLTAAFNFRSIVIWVSTSANKTISLETTNIYNMNLDKLCDEIYQQIQPDNHMLYTSSNLMNFRFNPDGTLIDFSFDFYAPKTFMGKQVYFHYQTSLKNNKLVIIKMNNIGSDDYFELIKTSPIELKSCFKGLDAMKLQSMLNQYTPDSPDYFSIIQVQLGKNSIEPSNNHDINLYVDGKGCTVITSKQKLENSAIQYTIAPIKGNTSVNMLNVYMDCPYINNMLKDNQ